MWGELSWGELSLGPDVYNSPRHGLYVNSLLGLSIKPKLKSKVDLHWKKKKNVFDICVCFDKISIVSSQTRETF